VTYSGAEASRLAALIVGQMQVARRRYTPDMAPWVRRLASLATVVALLASPAVLSACMAVCLPTDPATVADLDAPASMSHEHHAAASVPAVTPDHADHAHHGVPARQESPSPAVDGTASAAPPDPRLNWTCGDCCTDGTAGFAVGLGVERTDARAFSRPPAVVSAMSFLPIASASDVSPPGPPTSRPSLTKAPFVLRI
jgi:hypothetical protein